MSNCCHSVLCVEIASGRPVKKFLDDAGVVTTYYADTFEPFTGADAELDCSGASAEVDIHAELAGITDVISDRITKVFGLQADGTCVQVPFSLLYVDGLDQPWEEGNPNWIDPASIPKWCELRLSNGLTGCEVWGRDEDVDTAAPQWQQVR